MNRKHGQSKSPEYKAWYHMMARCYNPNDLKFPLYGGRGITVCDRWRDSIVNFLADMGKKPSSRHSLDRIDNSGNYEPGNCRWATPTEQIHNRHLKVRTHCPHGHLFTPENSYVYHDGKMRLCKTCVRRRKNTNPVRIDVPTKGGKYVP